MAATLAAAAAARRLAAPRLSTQAATLTHRRGLAGSADVNLSVGTPPNSTSQFERPCYESREKPRSNHHGPPKVNFWQDPMSPSRWKEEHFVIVSLSGWGLLFYGGYKLFTGGKGKKEEKPTEAAH